MGRAWLLVMLIGLAGCVGAARKPVVPGPNARIVDPKCVGPTKCERGDWLLGDDGKLVCTGTMHAVLACVPAK